MALPALGGLQGMGMTQKQNAREPSFEKRQVGLGAPVEGQDGQNKMGANGQRHQHARSPWSSSVLVLTTTLVSTVLLVAIIHSFFARQIDPKGCNMCGMWPAYARLGSFDTEHTRFASKYSLYLYREAVVNDDTTVSGFQRLPSG